MGMRNKKIIKKTLEKTNSVLVSRIKKEDYKKLLLFVKKLKVKISTGKNSSTILIFKKPIKFEGGKVGILTAGTSEVGVAEEARLMCEAMNCKCITSYCANQRAWRHISTLPLRDGKQITTGPQPIDQSHKLRQPLRCLCPKGLHIR